MDNKTRLDEKTVGNNEPIWVEAPTQSMADKVIEFGHEHGCTFKPMNYRGVLTERFTDDEFVYFDISDNPDFQMPKEAHRRLFLVGSHFPIKQIIIADDIEPYKDWNRWVEEGKRAAVEVAKATATVGMGIAYLIAMAPMFLLVDPKLIVVLADESWVSIAEWL